MIRIFNKKLIDSKKILYSLIKIYGINIFQSKRICKYVGINPKIKTDNLKIFYINRLQNFIKENIIVEYFLKKKKKEKINLLLKCKIIRGIRQYYGLPVRGQRTHSNAKTSKKFKQEKYGKKFNFM